MSEIRIPPEAQEAGALAILEQLDAIADEDGLVREREELTPDEQELFRRVARAAFLAMIESWPGMSQLAENDSASIREMAALILPLPQEASDDKA